MTSSSLAVETMLRFARLWLRFICDFQNFVCPSVLFQLALGLFPGRDHGLDLSSGAIDIRFSRSEFDLKRLLVEFDQNITLFDLGVVFDHDLSDPAGNFGSNTGDVCFDICIFGGDVTATPEPDTDGGDNGKAGNNDQQDRSNPTFRHD